MRVFQFALTGKGALLVGITRWSREPLWCGDEDWQPTGVSAALAPGEYLDPGGQIRRPDGSVRQEGEET